MGARLNVVFHEGNEAEPTCTIYGHWAGDNPEDAAKTIKSFFEAVEGQTTDHRYHDPGYLAAKYVVFLATDGKNSANPLDFLSVGCYKDADDCGPECVAYMDCSGHRGSRPTVRIEGDADELAKAYAILGQAVTA